MNLSVDQDSAMESKKEGCVSETCSHVIVHKDCGALNVSCLEVKCMHQENDFP